jgi:signal peptidase
MRRMKYLKILSMILVPVLLLASFVFLKTQSASYKVYVIHTGSMSPNIPSGSAVLVHKGHYRVGQVVTYTEQGLTITHRLLSIGPTGLITTKGDANRTPDPWHPSKTSIIGGVVIAPRWVGYWIIYFKNPEGLGSLFLAVLAIWQIWTITGEKSSESNEEQPPSPELTKSPRRIFSSLRTIRGGFSRRRMASNSLDSDSSRYARLFGNPKTAKQIEFK